MYGKSSLFLPFSVRTYAADSKAPGNADSRSDSRYFERCQLRACVDNVRSIYDRGDV